MPFSSLSPWFVTLHLWPTFKPWGSIFPIAPVVKKWWFLMILCKMFLHHKLLGPWNDNDNCAIFFFHRFIWNKHKCHSLICIVWTSMSFTLFKHQCLCLFTLFKHKCCMFICVVYTWKLCTQLLCLNNAQHSCLNNMNLYNNKFCMNLKWTHETCKFVKYVYHKGCGMSHFTWIDPHSFNTYLLVFASIGRHCCFGGWCLDVD